MKGVARRNLRRPVHAPHRRQIVVIRRRVEPLAEQRVELMTPIAGVERLAIESTAIDRRADDQRVETTVPSLPIRSKRLVGVPQAEIAFHPKRFLALAAPGADDFHLRVRTKCGADLHAAAPVVITEARARTDRRQARLERRYLPLIVAGRQIVQLAAHIQLPLAEERTLEAEGIARAPGRRLVREVS